MARMNYLLMNIWDILTDNQKTPFVELLNNTLSLAKNMA